MRRIAFSLICLSFSLSSVAQTIGPAPIVTDTTIKVTTAAPAVAGDAVALFTAPTSAACNPTATPMILVPAIGNVLAAASPTTLTLKDKLVQGDFVCGIIVHAGTLVPLPPVAVAAPPPAVPTISPAPATTDLTIKVVTGGIAAAGDPIALFSAPAPGGCNPTATPVALTTVGNVLAAVNPTTLTLKNKLATGTFVCAVVMHAGTMLQVPPIAVLAAPAPAAADGIKPKIVPTPADGDTKLTIVTAPAKAGDKIAIFSTTTAGTCDPTATAVALAPNTSTIVLDGAQTAVLLKDPVSANQILCAVITPKDGDPAVPLSEEATVNPPATPPGFDWGLVRAYFTLGALTSQERDQFSHQDLFLSFHLDKAYLPFKKQKNPDTTKDSLDQYTHRPGINSFFETRLTSIPVAVQSCTPSAAGVTPVVTCSNANTSSTTVTSPTSQAFLNSQKSARLQFGVYSPILLHQWHVASRNGTQATDTPYALFVAPLIKTGFDTSVNGLNQTQQGGSTPNTVQAIGTSSEFYKFYDFGFRLGHYEMTSNADVAPRLLSFIDVSVGRFSNLSSLICPKANFTGNNTCSSNAGTLPWARDMRLNVEGLLEIPATHGFSVGFSTNVVFDPFHLQGDGNNVHIRPADDLRFLFAYKFDITKIAAKLAPSFSGN